VAQADPHCTVDPATVPEAIGVITPPGVIQAEELDDTINQPVTRQGGLHPYGQHAGGAG
jgi:glucoamylase